MTPWVFGVALVVFASVLEGLAQVSLERTSIAVTAKARRATLPTALFVIEALVYTAALHWLDISTAYPLGALSRARCSSARRVPTKAPSASRRAKTGWWCCVNPVVHWVYKTVAETVNWHTLDDDLATDVKAHPEEEPKA